MKRRELEVTDMNREMRMARRFNGIGDMRDITRYAFVSRMVQKLGIRVIGQDLRSSFAVMEYYVLWH